MWNACVSISHISAKKGGQIWSRRRWCHNYVRIGHYDLVSVYDIVVQTRFQISFSWHNILYTSTKSKSIQRRIIHATLMLFIRVRQCNLSFFVSHCMCEIMERTEITMGCQGHQDRNTVKWAEKLLVWRVGVARGALSRVLFSRFNHVFQSVKSIYIWQNMNVITPIFRIEASLGVGRVNRK